MTEAERLAERLEEKAHNHTQDDIAEWSYMVEAAALLREQSARIASLEDALREIADMTQKKQLPITSMVNDKATEALGKGSE